LYDDSARSLFLHGLECLIDVIGFAYQYSRLDFDARGLARKLHMLKEGF
jgi:hypothetical protein